MCFLENGEGNGPGKPWARDINGTLNNTFSETYLPDVGQIGYLDINILQRTNHENTCLSWNYKDG